MKIIQYLKENLFFVISLFLLVFIPLYPKIPLLGVTHTFVYIRVEDILVALAGLVFLIQLVRRKVSINTPLTIPIVSYWVVGLISTVLGILFIFPYLSGVFPKIAFLYYLRHIEYMSLFFIAYVAITKKTQIRPMITVLLLTVSTVVLYALGQRFFPQYFLAFSTMNEEFAKGTPLVLSALGRIQSTFAGHYDLSAYLVLLIPIIGSLIFSYKRWSAKIALLTLSIASVIVLLMTASRTSFAMYLCAIVFMLFIRKQKKWIIPVVIVSLGLMYSFSGLYQRYVDTVKPVSVVTDQKGNTIGTVSSTNKGEVTIKDIQSTGENLPSGTKYIVSSQTPGESASSIKHIRSGSKSLDITNLQGNFIVKKALALDISFTTRVQAEWPRAIDALNRNLLFGSGYSTITLATDGNYFRILGETGYLGLLTFLSIFLLFGIAVYKTLPQIDSEETKGFILGISAGLFGLALNAVLIDVYESSKIAYTLWLLMGMSLAILALYQKEKIEYVKQLKSLFFSIPSIVFFLIMVGIVVFFPMVNNFFVGDDFTWLRWIGDCQKLPGDTHNCYPIAIRISEYFLSSSDFFYRPMEKVFFLSLYYITWLNPVLYHLVSLALHLATTTLLFFISLRIFNKKTYATVTAICFLLVSNHAETVYWIAASGHLFASFFCILGVWLYMKWTDNTRWAYLLGSILSIGIAPFFHEYGIVGILFIAGYMLVTYRQTLGLEIRKQKIIGWYIAPLIAYFLLKFISGSLWATGDYSYNLVKLPLNAVGNLLGAIGLTVFGEAFFPYYDSLRGAGREQLLLSGVVLLIAVSLLVILYVYWYRRLTHMSKTTILYSLLFTVVPLLPFLGLGNIAPRYTYLASFGVLLFLVYCLETIQNKLKQLFPKIVVPFVIILTLLFTGYHTVALRNQHTHWQEAGYITNNFILYMNDVYEEFFTLEDPIFYFVDVPIRHKSAWVFPVGLPDALWFDYKDKPVTSYILPTLDAAKKVSSGSANTKIFQFQKDGTLLLIK